MEDNIEIDEAASKGYDKRVQELLSDKIYFLIDNVEQGKISNFILSSGNIVSLKCEAIKNNTYVFNVVKDDSKAFKKWEILTIELKVGNGENSTADYKLNSKVITTQDGGETFDLIFNASKKSGLNDNFKINKIRDVKLTAEEPSETEKEKPIEEPSNTGEEPTEKKPLSSREEKLKEDGEDSLAYMLKDALLKKAFYEQPKLWNLFVAELTGKKAKGKGIITVSGLVKKYAIKKSSNELNARFIEGKNVEFSPLEKITLVKADDNKIVLEKGGVYNTVVMEHELGFYPRISGDYEGFKYVLEIKSRILNTPDSFNVNVNMVDEEGELHFQSTRKIQINPKKSNGYQSNKEANSELTKEPTKK